MARKSVYARCTDCDKEWDSKNAQGVAARHANATGHEVIVEIVIGYVQGPKDGHPVVKGADPGVRVKNG